MNIWSINYFLGFHFEVFYVLGIRNLTSEEHPCQENTCVTLSLGRSIEFPGRICQSLGMITLQLWSFFKVFSNSSELVGSTEACSKVFLLFFLFSDWLKSNHLRNRIERGFLTFFRAKPNGKTTQQVLARKMFRWLSEVRSC